MQEPIESLKPVGEDKRVRFKRLAAKRTREVLERLRVLGNCANKNLYEYAEADIRKIFAVIENQVKEIKLKFKSSKTQEFKL